MDNDRTPGNGSPDGRVNGSTFGASTRTPRGAGLARNSGHGGRRDVNDQTLQQSAELESLSLEAALDELDRITAALEESQRPLEESLALYERGVRLVQHSQELLDSADLRLQRLRAATENDDVRGGFALDEFEIDEE